MWSAVTDGELRPVALSPGKMYATWGDPEPWRAVISADAPLWTAECQVVAGQQVVVLHPRQAEPYRWQKYLPPAAVPGAKKVRAVIASYVNR